MHVKAVRADPAGNITVLVTDPVLPNVRVKIAAAILAKSELAAEQVGFVVPPVLDTGSTGRLEMMGGEFCGNASRAFGLFLVKVMGNSPREVMIEVSGCDHPISVWADPRANTATAQMPLPVGVWPMTVAGVSCVRVDFEGIAHLVADCSKPRDDLLCAARELFEPVDALGAYGVLFFDRAAGHIVPAVAVKATKSLVWEGSCGSGSVAAAVADALDQSEGDYCRTFIQPAGSITVSLFKDKGAVCRATIGGAVTLGEPAVYAV